MEGTEEEAIVFFTEKGLKLFERLSQRRDLSKIEDSGNQFLSSWKK